MPKLYVAPAYPIPMPQLKVRQNIVETTLPFLLPKVPLTAEFGVLPVPRRRGGKYPNSRKVC